MQGLGLRRPGCRGPRLCDGEALKPAFQLLIREFPKIGVPYFAVLIIRILLFRVLYLGPLFSETPTYPSGTRPGDCRQRVQFPRV